MQIPNAIKEWDEYEIRWNKEDQQFKIVATAFDGGGLWIGCGDTIEKAHLHLIENIVNTFNRLNLLDYARSRIGEGEVVYHSHDREEGE